MTAIESGNFEYLLGSSNWSPMSNYMEPPKKKRTRACLDHMTPEEKRERRKEKNRQAAQTARDRKRNRLERLEEENKRLREENMRLRGAILGNGPVKQVVNCSPSTQFVSPIRPPIIQVNDSGIGDVDSKSATSLDSPASKVNNCLDHFCGSDGRTTTPDSSCNYGTSVVSPMPSEESFIDSIIETDNDIALVNEIRELVSYVNGDNGDGVSLESAALINEPQQQVQDASTGSLLTENSLGWTSIQIMLILMISRIHHRSSAKIKCCQRVPTKSNETDGEMDPSNCNLYDYVMRTQCVDFRKTAETIISNKGNVRQQRLVALDFVRKYLCHANFLQKKPREGSGVRRWKSN